jgi:hypothetical protein
VFTQFTRGRHGAPSTRRWLTRHTAPAPDARPSLELPAGHMRQRPYDEHVIGDGRRFRSQDVVEITNTRFAPHIGQVGVIVEITGTFRPLVVEIPDKGVVYLAEDEVRLLDAAPADADTLVMDAALDELPLMGGASL